ncbi:MAG: hypothetical protein IJS24_00340, partial [Eubacterium sp.]|nr:hypothetical protein [Eubacterium sp.]
MRKIISRLVATAFLLTSILGAYTPASAATGILNQAADGFYEVGTWEDIETMQEMIEGTVGNATVDYAGANYRL